MTKRFSWSIRLLLMTLTIVGAGALQASVQAQAQRQVQASGQTPGRTPAQAPGRMQAQRQGAAYPPLEQYLMPKDAEVLLARSAAPANISSRATIKVLTASGFQVVHEGDNGFVCEVMRGWSAPSYTPVPFRDLVYDPTVRAPICFNPGAAREVLPYYELRTKLGMAGKTPDQIAAGVESALAKGELPARDMVTFAYMWSADQVLGPGIGHWHPHMMVFAPYATNAMLGDNDPMQSHPMPVLSDDAGTPFAVVVIPVDENMFVKATGSMSTKGSKE